MTDPEPVIDQRGRWVWQENGGPPPFDRPTLGDGTTYRPGMHVFHEEHGFGRIPFLLPQGKDQAGEEREAVISWVAGAEGRPNHVPLTELQESF